MYLCNCPSSLMGKWMPNENHRVCIVNTSLRRPGKRAHERRSHYTPIDLFMFRFGFIFVEFFVFFSFLLVVVNRCVRHRFICQTTVLAVSIDVFVGSISICLPNIFWAVPSSHNSIVAQSILFRPWH